MSAPPKSYAPKLHKWVELAQDLSFTPLGTRFVFPRPNSSIGLGTREHRPVTYISKIPRDSAAFFTEICAVTSARLDRGKPKIYRLCWSSRTDRLNVRPTLPIGESYKSIPAQFYLSEVRA